MSKALFFACQKTLLVESASSDYLVIQQKGEVTKKIGTSKNPIKDYLGKDSSDLYFMDPGTKSVFKIKNGKLYGARLPGELTEGSAPPGYKMFGALHVEDNRWVKFIWAPDRAEATRLMKITDSKVHVQEVKPNDEVKGLKRDMAMIKSGDDPKRLADLKDQMKMLHTAINEEFEGFV
jgi:hypothetical protein